MMLHERRHSIRKTPDHFVYLSLPSNNGGVVLDVSEGGLGFQSIAPLEANGPIQFRFAIDSSERIRAVGEVAWKDESGKIGGLRFTQLPEEVREQIRVWAGQAKASVLEPPVADAALAAEVALIVPEWTSAADLPAVEPAIEAEVAPALPEWMAALEIPVAELPIEAESAASGNGDLLSAVPIENPLPYNLRPSTYDAPFSNLSIFSEEWNSETGSTDGVAPQSVVMRHPISAVGLTIALALFVSMGICAYVYTGRTGDIVFEWGEKVWGRSHSQPISPIPMPPARSTPGSSEIPKQ